MKPLLWVNSIYGAPHSRDTKPFLDYVRIFLTDWEEKHDRAGRVHSAQQLLRFVDSGKRPGKRLDGSRLRAGFVPLKNH